MSDVNSTTVAAEPNSPRPWPAGPAVITALLSWVVISLGFVGLKMLMAERPEFVGQPLTGDKAALVQESPTIAIRKSSDDVSVVKPMQPELAEVRFEVAGRRDYRGLHTIMDMSGEFHGKYSLTNIHEEPIFVLFKCPHPRTGGAAGGNLPAGGLRLEASSPGVQENAGDA